jgi:hypothetical protein
LRSSASLRSYFYSAPPSLHKNAGSPNSALLRLGKNTCSASLRSYFLLYSFCNSLSISIINKLNPVFFCFFTFLHRIRSKFHSAVICRVVGEVFCMKGKSDSLSVQANKKEALRDPPAAVRPSFWPEWTDISQCLTALLLRQTTGGTSYHFIVREILFFARSTPRTLTSTTSPTLTASNGCLINRSQI